MIHLRDIADVSQQGNTTGHAYLLDPNKPGAWNDLDSLERGQGDGDGLTSDECQTAITLWAISCSPLILGSDLTKLEGSDLVMLTHPEVLAVHQGGESRRAALAKGSATNLVNKESQRFRRRPPQPRGCARQVVGDVKRPESKPFGFHGRPGPLVGARLGGLCH